MRKFTFIKSLIVMLLSICSMGVWATDYSNAVHSFTSSSLASGLSTNGTFNSSYYKMESGNYAEITAATLFGEESLSTDMKVNVACGTFGTWSGDKTVKLTAAFLASDNSVLSSQEFTTGTLNSTQGTYRGEFIISKPTNVANIAKLRVTFSNFTTGDVARLAGIKLTYSTKSADPLPTYTLNITQPSEGGVLTVKNGSNNIANGASVEVGTKLTCEVTNIPEGKRFSRFYVRYDNDGEKYKSTNPATFDNLPTEGITAATVSVTYQDLEQYTVTYKMFGVTIGSENVYEGNSIANAPTPSIADWTLTGWTTDDSYVSSATAPSIFNSPITSDVVLHAVFSQSTGNGPGTATLTNKEICDNLTNSYATGSITNSYGTWNYNATKQGNYSSDGEYFMQLRNNATVSYLQIPEVSGNITSIVLGRVCNTSKAQYTGSIYFRETAANNATNIASATQETVLTDVTLEIPAGYSTGYVMVSAACRIESVTVNYVDGVTTYTIADPRPKTTINITTPEGYSTFYCEDAIELPEGVEGSTVTVAGEALTLAWEYQAGDVVPAGTPILVKGTQGAHTATITTGGDPVGTNYLVANTTGAAEDAYVLADDIDAMCYVLGYDTNGENLGFYWYTATGDGDFKVPAGKVFLAVPASAGVKSFFTFDSEADAINKVEVENENGAIYDLSGRRVNNATKGIYIKNGKKYMVK